MSRFFNVNIDSIINDHELSYQNTQDNFIKECKQMYDKLLKLYIQKVEERSKVLSMYICHIALLLNYLKFINLN